MQQLVDDIADALRQIDACGVPFKHFQHGVGPYGEPQLVKLVSQSLFARHPARYAGIKTCRIPDVLVPNSWALEFKIVRPFGDNGAEAEHWSQNLLHPYPGNVSAMGDAMKLIKLERPERKGIVVISYEHDPPVIDVSPLIASFEIVSREILNLPLGTRNLRIVAGCVHPVHQRATVYGWELTRI
jgi:hypothetical protein